MYKMNYDRFVLSLWDEQLKEDIHEAYYDGAPDVYKLRRDPKAAITAVRNIVEILVKWILEIQEVDQKELMAFVLRHHTLIADRIERILDKEEISIQLKRRGIIR